MAARRTAVAAAGARRPSASRVRREMASRQSVAIVVLGGGRESSAPEYGVASLSPLALERLRFGVWLGRQTGAPIMFSGGLATLRNRASEADVAAEIAGREFGCRCAGSRAASRDTRENAQYAVARSEGEPDHACCGGHARLAHAARLACTARSLDASRGDVGARPGADGLGGARRTPDSALGAVIRGVSVGASGWREKLGWWLGA